MAHTSNPIYTRSIDNYMGDRTIFEGRLAVVRTEIVTITKVRDNRLIDVTDQNGQLLQGYAPNAVLPIIR